MVCVPCFIIPVLLFLWHRFVQPYVLRFWNPWAKKDKDGNVIKDSGTEFPFQCKGGVCPFPAKDKSIKQQEVTGGSGSDNGTTTTTVGGGEAEETKKSQ
uniref:Putative conserved secreted protein n=1 Tax=Aedes albopictus TaxID=7160 RepID=A0A1W7R770_AEDAL